jgi:hypothetical protein
LITINRCSDADELHCSKLHKLSCTTAMPRSPSINNGTPEPRSPTVMEY